MLKSFTSSIEVKHFKEKWKLFYWTLIPAEVSYESGFVCPFVRPPIHLQQKISEFIHQFFSDFLHEVRLS